MLADKEWWEAGITNRRPGKFYQSEGQQHTTIERGMFLMFFALYIASEYGGPEHLWKHV